MDNALGWALQICSNAITAALLLLQGFSCYHTAAVSTWNYDTNCLSLGSGWKLIYLVGEIPLHTRYVVSLLPGFIGGLAGLLELGLNRKSWGMLVHTRSCSVFSWVGTLLLAVSLEKVN